MLIKSIIYDTLFTKLARLFKARIYLKVALKSFKITVN